MPRGDGTGPLGRGPMTGRGMGRGGGVGGGRGAGRGAGRGMGAGRGRGAGIGGGRLGRNGAVADVGGEKVVVVGNCVCPECGTTVPHRWGVPCNEEVCPKCGASMVRQD